MGRRQATLTLRREDGRIICDAVTVADSTLRRVYGLLGRRTLPAGEGMTLRPAWSIHTAFMRFPIDVVFIDADQGVMRVEHNLRPFKTATCRGAREVVELAAGECERRGVEAGERIAWASRNIVNTIATRESPALQVHRRATVLVASSDQRFVKLVRFLLEERGIAVGDQTVPAALSRSLTDADVAAVLLDAGTSLGDGLRALNAARAQRSDLRVVIVAESTGENAPTSVRVYNKWNETAAAIDAVEQAVAVAGTEAE
ncbi:MAG: DUF192 domain-containing protein [Thermoleophilia bacterium]|nr:DUF192 domain-containing protein [Thermoleophilia bacterium]